MALAPCSHEDFGAVHTKGAARSRGCVNAFASLRERVLEVRERSHEVRERVYEARELVHALRERAHVTS